MKALELLGYVAVGAVCVLAGFWAGVKMWWRK